MQEEVEQRTVTLAVNTSKMTANVLKSAISKYLAYRKEKKREGPVKPCGKQSVKQLVGQDQREALRNLPVYIFSATFAKGHDELEEYRASFRANVDCKNAIEEAIANHYADNRLDGSCVQEVVDRFGAERVSFVLANTIQHKDWDGRISPENKEWAKAEPVPNDFDAWHNKKTLEYSCNQAHPGLINLFVNRFRKEQELAAEKKPSVLQKLKEAKVDTPSKAPSKKKEVEL